MASVFRKFSPLLLGLGITLICWGSLLLMAGPSWADDLNANNELIVVAGKITVRPDKVQEFIDLSQHCLESSRTEAGSLSYTVYQDEAQANNFLFFEEWKNRAALDYHFQTPYFKEFMSRTESWFTAPPQIKIYSIDSFTNFD